MTDIHLIGQFPLLLEEFARAGGGGSGGGSSSGGGSVLTLIGFLAYLPLYGIGKLLRLGRYGDAWSFLQAIGWTVASLVALVLIVVNFFMGSAAFIFFIYITLPVGVGALLGMGGGLYAWFSKLRQSGKTTKALKMAASKDHNWNETQLTRYGEGLFYQFQKDWSSSNYESMRRYLTPRYLQHILLMLHALHQIGRVNQVVNPKIKKSMITNAYDSTDNSQDTFTIGMTAIAKDKLIDKRSNTLLYEDKNEFTEFWQLKRHNNTWLLDGIGQQTSSVVRMRADIQQFAQQHNLYYSMDWGWLLLPPDGYIFQKGKFGTSDINNHTIGMMNGQLVQLYTYQPSPRRDLTDQYLVIQMTIPKSYGRILVKRRSRLINWPVSGLTKVQMEWGEFNEMYDVYASDMERVTSFELLHPAFMAQLRDLDFEVNIEVVDNVVYLFTKSMTSVSVYSILFALAAKAYKEMKL